MTRLAAATLSAVTAAALIASPTGLSAQGANEVVRVSPRVLATYQFGAARAAAVALPLTVTVADSAGQLVAIAAIPGERAPRPFTVAVVERDLVLQGETPAGTLTLVLEQQADGETPTLRSGRWSLDSLGGTLRARR